MPGRYAKFEASSGLIDSIDRYAYRAPNAQIPVADPPEGGADANPEEQPVPTESSIEARSGDLPAAIHHYQSVLEIDPNHAGAKQALASLQGRAP